MQFRRATCPATALFCVVYEIQMVNTVTAPQNELFSFYMLESAKQAIMSGFVMLQLKELI